MVTKDIPLPVNVRIPPMTAFSIMFVSIGMVCFIWQAMTAGEMFYKSRKPILGLVFAQAVLGIVVTIVTLLTSLTKVDCTFRLLFSVVGVNVADISLQFVLLWKAYLGNNRSKVILGLGCIPLLSIASFIIANMTFGKSISEQGVGLCDTEYPTFIVIAKAIIDCTSNTFLSGCFLLVIYRHYRILGSSIQKTLITEGLIYCFGVCLSNILTGILMAKNVLGGSTPILYTIDWYLASYLIIQQLRYRHKKSELNEVDDDDDDDSNSSIVSTCHHPSCRHNEETQAPAKIPEDLENKERDAYYQSISSTLYASPSSMTAHQASFTEGDEGKLYPMPSLPPFEKKIYDYSRKNSSTKLLEDNHDITIESLAVQDNPELPKPANSQVEHKK